MKLPDRSTTITIPPNSIAMPQLENQVDRLRNRLAPGTFSPVNQNGSFEFDRVIKSGYVLKRTQKTKVRHLHSILHASRPSAMWESGSNNGAQAWKTIYLVLRPHTLSIYKTEQEDKLRRKIYLSDLTAVTLLKDPKQKRQHVFGLFSPSRNFHFQANSPKEAQDWVDVIRKDARIDEEEEEMLLASPAIRRQSYVGVLASGALVGSPPGDVQMQQHQQQRVGSSGNVESSAAAERLASSSPEPPEPPATSRFGGAKHTTTAAATRRRSSYNMESSGLSGNELASHSDFSDNEMQHVVPGGGVSFESLAVQSPPSSSLQLPMGATVAAAATGPATTTATSAPGEASPDRPVMGNRNASQVSGLNVEQDPDRIVWQGWLWQQRSKGGVKQWKDMWAVLRPRNLILYKDESEYTAQFILPMSSIVNVVDLDPASKTKVHTLQIITEEKSHRLCAHGEEELVHCLGAFKSLIAKRRGLEAKHAAAAAAPISTPEPPLVAVASPTTA